MRLGDKLRGLIEERGLTQKEIAKQLNIAPSTMGSYVQNTREPDFDTLKLLANYFQVSADYLLDYRPDQTITPQESELLRVFRALNTEQQAIYLEQGKAFIKVNTNKK
ncbi:MAG TPA: helix-turn-helix transcriptional regulator [Candidatus Scubalenecus merdavium]|uniref:Helix-turn-helix transcriptional regulator n=1 Tax=Candidatus Scybalenecus merdavium TaxID=2840939 RepID=A0A9D1MTU8_9FIRM|nr:helix-turn-helix transcriptional regulator [Candidatus Scubalenecus merdavium]